MITTHTLKNQIIVLSGNVTEKDFDNNIIVVRGGSNIIGCKFKSCKIFIEGCSESGERPEPMKFTSSSMGKKEDFMQLSTTVDVFLKNYVE